MYKITIVVILGFHLQAFSQSNKIKINKSTHETSSCVGFNNILRNNFSKGEFQKDSLINLTKINVDSFYRSSLNCIKLIPFDTLFKIFYIDSSGISIYQNKTTLSIYFFNTNSNLKLGFLLIFNSINKNLLGLYNLQDLLNREQGYDNIIPLPPQNSRKIKLKKAKKRKLQRH